MVVAKYRLEPKYGTKQRKTTARRKLVGTLKDEGV
jgi:hypothetical protein